MTKKNATKTAARELKAKHGGDYQTRLREVGGGGRGEGYCPSHVVLRPVPLPPATLADELAFLTRARQERTIPLLSLANVEYVAACQLVAKDQIEMVGDAESPAYARIPMSPAACHTPSPPSPV